MQIYIAGAFSVLFKTGYIPLPQPDRLATSWLPNLVCGERYGIIQKAIQSPEFVKGERSECSSPLTTKRENKLVRGGWFHEVRPSTCKTPWLLIAVAEWPPEQLCIAKCSEYTSKKWHPGATFSSRFSTRLFSRVCDVRQLRQICRVHV